MGLLTEQQYQERLARYKELTKILELPGAFGNLSVEVSPAEDYEESDAGILVPKHEPRILESHRQPVMSYNRNHTNVIACQFLGINSTGTVGGFGDGELNVKDQTNTLRGSTIYGLCWYGYLGMNAAKNNDLKGIVVGTGNTAESFEDYVMDAMIDDGTGAGELEYFAQCRPTITWDGSGRTFTIVQERFLKNQDGSSITINEVGWIEYVYATNLRYYILLLRDVLSSGVAIAAGKVARVTLEMTTAAYPS